MLSWDDFEQTPEQGAKAPQKAKPANADPSATVGGDDFELSAEGPAEVPDACGIDNPDCEACQ